MKKKILVMLFILIPIITISYYFYILKTNNVISNIKITTDKINQTPQTKEIVLKGIKRKLEYDKEQDNPKLKNLKGNNTDIFYTDKANNTYYFNQKTGKMVGFMITNDQFTDYGKNNSIKELRQDQIIEKAKDFLKNVLNFSKYSFKEATFNNELKIYYVRYVKKINGFFTQDSYQVGIDVFGNIMNYDAQGLNMFDGINIPNINEKILIKNIDSVIKTYTKNENMKYTIRDKILSINDKGKIIIRCYVEYSSGYSRKSDFYNADIITNIAYRELQPTK